jgi:ubiquinone/menaquinone biosynthesis C-methylase UbiE
MTRSRSSLEPEQLFDAEAARYDAAYDRPGRAGAALRSRLATVGELLGTGPGRVLDAGMGAGRLAAELEQSGWQVSGVDLSQEMLARARTRLPHAGTRLVKASIEHLPFQAESFDAVVATGVLEYSTDLESAVNEVTRVLAGGGRAVVSFPNYRSVGGVWRRRLVNPVLRIVLGNRASRVPRRLLTREEFEGMLEKAGLEIEAVAFVPNWVEGGGELRARLFARQFLFSAAKPAAG